jgi:MFS family permease
VLTSTIGTVIGQVGFGILADIVGRKRMYGLELIIIIFATVAQALSSDSPSMSIVGVIIFWRVLMGMHIQLQAYNVMNLTDCQVSVLAAITHFLLLSPQNSPRPSGVVP